MSPVVFAQPDPRPTTTTVMTHEVWRITHPMNSSRAGRELVATVGQIVPEDDAKSWGVGGEATEGYYFVGADEPIEVVDGPELLKRAERLEIPDRERMDANRLREAVNAAEKAGSGTKGDDPVRTAAVPPPADAGPTGQDVDGEVSAAPRVQTQERKGPRRTSKD